MKTINNYLKIRTCICGNTQIHALGLCVKCYKKKYYAENKDLFLIHSREQRKRNLGYYLYYIECDSGIEYIGSTIDVENRCSKHMTGGSNLECDFEEWKKRGFKRFAYFEVDKGLLSDDENLARKELYYLEQVLINRYKPSLNSRQAFVNEKIKLSRLEELDVLMESIDVEDFSTKYYSSKRTEKKDLVTDITQSFTGINTHTLIYT